MSNVMVSPRAPSLVAWRDGDFHRVESNSSRWKKAAVSIDNVKCTTDVAKEVRFCLGEVEARAFYTALKSKGGLGWSHQRFNQVCWWALELTLAKKPDRYGLWLSKQVSGWCATRKNIARIQDLLDDKCPNCQQVAETSEHLNCCPDEGRTQLFKESVGLLEKWLLEDNRTNPELAFWIPKYLLFRGQKLFADMGPMSANLQRAAASQDIIGWVEFLHGKVSEEIAQIQIAHCSLSSCRMNGRDWMKHFVSHLLHISHSQWIFRNFVLHDRSRGNLQLKARREVLIEIETLVDTHPDQTPAESQFCWRWTLITFTTHPLKSNRTGFGQ